MKFDKIKNWMDNKTLHQTMGNIIPVQNWTLTCAVHVKNKVRQNKKDEWIIQISPDHGQFHTSLRSHRVLQTLENLIENSIYIYIYEGKNEIQNAEKETKRKIPNITKFKKSGIYYNKCLPKLDWNNKCYAGWHFITCICPAIYNFLIA